MNPAKNYLFSLHIHKSGVHLALSSLSGRKFPPRHTNPSSKTLELNGFIIFLLHWSVVLPPILGGYITPQNIQNITPQNVQNITPQYTEGRLHSFIQGITLVAKISASMYIIIFFFFSLSFFTGYLSIFSFLFG